jgi:hypothetical protein
MSDQRAGPPKEVEGRVPHQDRPSTENNRYVSHAADLSIVASARRPLPQELHADLGIVDDASAVGADT